MHGAIQVRAYLVDGADIAALGDDGLGGELTFLELGTLGVVLRLRAVVSNRGVLVPRQNGASLLLHPVGGTYLYPTLLTAELTGLGSAEDIRAWWSSPNHIGNTLNFPLPGNIA